jgi:hypothetical protein
VKFNLVITADRDYDGKKRTVRVEEDLNKIVTCHKKESLRISCDDGAATATKNNLENFQAHLVKDS